MRINTLFLIAYISSILILGVFWTIENVFLADRVFVSQIHDRLMNISNSRREELRDLIKSRGFDVTFLSESYDVESMLTNGVLSLDGDTVKKHNESKLQIISEEIENYVSKHPGMTLKELIENREFENVAMRRVGENSHVFVYNASDFDRVLYASESGLTQTRFVTEQEIVKIGELNDSFGEGDGGVLGMGEIFEGDVYEKYGYFMKSSVVTADNIALGIGIISNSSDYKILKEIPAGSISHIKSFCSIKKCSNLLLVSPEGKIIYMNNPDENLGSDVEWISEREIRDAVEELSEEDEFLFKGPFDYQGTLKIAMSARVDRVGGHLGYVILIDDFERFSNVASNLVGLGESGVNYLTNLSGQLITPLRGGNFDLFVQNIKDENFDDCLKKMDEVSGFLARNEKYVELEGLQVREFRNYLEELTIGVGIYIPEARWCQITRFDSDESFGEIRRGKVMTEIFIICSSVVALVIYFLIRRIIRRRSTSY